MKNSTTKNMKLHYFLILLMSFIIPWTGIMAQDGVKKSIQSKNKIEAVKEVKKNGPQPTRYNQKRLANDPNSPFYDPTYRKSTIDNVQSRFEFDFERLKDPATGEIPVNIKERELLFVNSSNSGLQRPTDNLLLQEGDLDLGAAGDQQSAWVNRGPYNVGGRTRALAIDLNNENIILAGGVSGGMWRTTDQGVNWTRVTGSDQHPGITDVVQDPRPGFQNTWYHSTGEVSGSSQGARNFSARYTGNGIFKSTDNGITWTLLPATITDSPQNFSLAEPFEFISGIEVDPSNGNLYVATFVGIYRSTDGGVSFQQVLNANATFLGHTDIHIASDGTLFAAIPTATTNGSSSGIYRSTDGALGTWVNITDATFTTVYGRTVIYSAPSSPNVLYILADGTSSAPVGHDFWKYTYVSGDGSGAGGTWEDRSANLPNIGGNVGSFTSQRGYDLFVRVHPTDPDFVLIGGTNIYRSTDGFATAATATSWIAGYSPLNNVSLYTNHHPDQHSLVFLPSDPNKVISGHDGGISMTTDITSVIAGIEPVAWTSLNNGYLTTQVYALSIGPTDQILSGFQDNSTWFTNNATPTDPWVDLNSGDGSYNAFNATGELRYMSSQAGNVRRNTYADANSTTLLASTRLAPVPSGVGNGNFIFVAPFELDPNDDEIMYLAQNTNLWRNDNLPNATTTFGWAQLTNATASSNISSIGISESPANIVYFGTTGGQVYRIDNANVGNPASVDIFTGKGLPVGNVTSIDVNPRNSNDVVIAFSNYSIVSIFHSTDGGDTWENISGNLEENVDGSGAGPSVRWVASVGNSDRYFAGTSTGLYSTTTLNGASTVWAQEDLAGITNTVIEQIRVRDSDGLVVIGTHGNGIYSGNFEVSVPNNDLVAVSIDNLSNNAVVSGPQDVTVTFRNDGLLAQGSFDAELALNGSLIATETITLAAPLAKGASVAYTFSQQADIALPGANEITVTALLAIDELPDNNSISVDLLSGNTPLIGEYTMIQLELNGLSAGFGGNGSLFGPNGIDIVNLEFVDNDTRALFTSGYLQGLVGPNPTAHFFDLNTNGDVVFQDNQQSAGINTALLLGTANTPGVFDPNDPSAFTLNIRENINNAFGVTARDVEFQLFINEAPTAVGIDVSTINEGQPIGSLVGLLSGVDPNPNDIFSFELGGTDAVSFTIGSAGGNELLTSAVFDAGIKSVYDIDVTVTDVTGGQFVQNLIIDVNDVVLTAPTFTFSNIGVEDITIDISDVTGSSAFEVDVSTDNFNTFVAGLENFVVTGNQGVLSGLNSNVTYNVRVKATNELDAGPFSATADVLTLPASITVAEFNITAESFDISFTSPDGATSFEIDVSTDGFATFVSGFENLVVNTASASVTGLSPITTYNVRSRALNASGNSDNSAILDVTTLPTIPTAPSTLTADGSDGQGVTLSWTDNADNEADFAIERSEDGTTFAEIATAVADAVSFLDATAVADVSYSYRVAARNSGGTSAYSNVATATRVAELPAAPSTLSADGSDGQGVTLSWTDNADNEADFAIERSEDGTTFAEIATAVADAVSFLDATAVADVSYSYRVAARNSGGTSTYSNVATATRVAELPAAPSTLTADGSDGQGVTLSWTDNADNEVDFVVERSEDGTTFAEIATADADAVTFLDATAVADVSYSYRVAARNSGGTSAYSNVATAARVAELPAAPSTLTADGFDGQGITLDWADNSSNEAEFALERSEDGTFTEIGTATADATTYTDATAAAGINYSYRVAARNSGGISEYSNVAAFFITGVEDDLLYQDIKISPNPSNGFYTLSLDNIKVSRLSLWNSVGQMVMEKSFDLNDSNNKLELDIRNEDAGIYLLLIEIEDDTRIIRKLSKK